MSPTMNPNDRVTGYLFAHRSTIALGTLNDAISAIKLDVFFGAPAPISDDEIRKLVVGWATINCPVILVSPVIGGSPAPGTAPAAAPSNSDLIDAVNKAINILHDRPIVGSKDANNVSLGVSGLTANLKSATGNASVGVSWTGSLKIKADSGNVHFEGTVSDSSWELKLSFPRDSYPPNMATLGQVFTKGLDAVGQIVDATRSFNNLSDVSRIAGQIKPYTNAVSDAADAMQGIAETPRKSGISFGFKIGSPDPMPGQQGMPPGVQAEAVFTWVF